MPDAKKVLVAEDEKPMAQALELKLKNAGYNAKAVFDGASAVEELQKEPYDLMLLDLVMPKMDGFEVLQKVKELGLKTRIIVSSNLSQEADKEKAMGLGAVDYFVKSNTPITAVIEHVKTALQN